MEEKSGGKGGGGREGGGRRKPNRSYVDVEEERSERGGSGDCEHGVQAWSREVLSSHQSKKAKAPLTLFLCCALFGTHIQTPKDKETDTQC